MSTQEIALPARERRSFDYRVLGIIGMILSPMLFLASFFYAPMTDAPNPQQFFASLGGFLYLCGALASATAMRKLRVTGTGKGAVVLFAVQTVGLILAMMFDVIEYAAPQLKQSTVYFVTDMAYPFSHVLMIFVGIAVVRAKVWRGWRVIPAFMIGFALPLFFIAIAIIGRENGNSIFPLLITSGFFLLGYAVKTTK